MAERAASSNSNLYPGLTEHSVPSSDARKFTQSTKKKSKSSFKGTDLKSKEDEYMKLNEEIEARAASLLKEADSFLMRDTELLLNTSQSLDSSPQKTNLVEHRSSTAVGPTRAAGSQPAYRPATSGTSKSKLSSSGVKRPPSKGVPKSASASAGTHKSRTGSKTATTESGTGAKSVNVATSQLKASVSDFGGTGFEMGAGLSAGFETRTANVGDLELGSDLPAGFGTGMPAASRERVQPSSSYPGDGREGTGTGEPLLLGNLLEDHLQSSLQSPQVSPPRNSRFYDDILPEIQEGVGSEALIRILKAKVRVMQEEVDRLSQECKDKDKVVNGSESKFADLCSEQSRLKKAQQSLVAQMDRQKQLVEELRHKNERLEGQVSSMKKELDVKERTHKQLLSAQGSTDVRLNRALEEAERYRISLQQAKAQNKELGEQEKKKKEKILNDNKTLERQKTELIAAFKKQQIMIDILKRQKIHLEAAKVLSFTEEEFVKALDWGTQ